MNGPLKTEISTQLSLKLRVTRPIFRVITFVNTVLRIIPAGSCFQYSITVNYFTMEQYHGIYGQMIVISRKLPTALLIFRFDNWR